MNLRNNLLLMLGMVSFVGLFSACDAMDWMYDDTITGGRADAGGNSSSQKNDSIHATDSTGQTIVVHVKEGQYYVDATSYTQWVYVGLHGDSLAISVADISTEDYSERGAPEQWDYAHHRYDIKTNGGSVMMTDCHSIEELESAGLPPSPVWTEDEYSDNSITIDMSHMLEGYLVYAPGYKNKEAGRWLDVDTSTMPPLYTMRDNVMLFRFSDGTYAAIQLVNYMSTDRYQTKGWMTVNYKFPVFVE